jgi:coenzyme Q-binding protein COQ10
MKTTWSFTPGPTTANVDSGPATVDFDIIFAFNNPVHAAAAQAFFNKVSGDVMEAFEKRCREVYGNAGARL